MNPKEMNKEKREKKQKKKKVEECSIGELIIEVNPTYNFSYLEQFTLDSFIQQTVKMTGQDTNEKESKLEKKSHGSKENECEAAESDDSLDITHRIMQLCDSI